jgi:hypothetical protein
MSASTVTASVSISGIKETASVSVPEFSTVEDVLNIAAGKLGVPQGAAKRFAPVVNGKSANLDTIVPDNAVLTAAPRVQNG